MWLAWAETHGRHSWALVFFIKNKTNYAVIWHWCDSVDKQHGAVQPAHAPLKQRHAARWMYAVRKIKTSLAMKNWLDSVNLRANKAGVTVTVFKEETKRQAFETQAVLHFQFPEPSVEQRQLRRCSASTLTLWSLFMGLKGIVQPNTCSVRLSAVLLLDRETIVKCSSSRKMQPCLWLFRLKILDFAARFP